MTKGDGYDVSNNCIVSPGSILWMLFCQDDKPYDGQVVKMGTPCYIIGITKAIRNKICKSFGDEIAITIREH